MKYKIRISSQGVIRYGKNRSRYYRHNHCCRTRRPFANTVDTLKTGAPQQKVRAIATTFLATSEVIEPAIQRGVDLIITHEPTFYGHTDETRWLRMIRSIGPSAVSSKSTTSPFGAFTTIYTPYNPIPRSADYSSHWTGRPTSCLSSRLYVDSRLGR